MREAIFSKSLEDAYKNRSQDFTRNRKLTFSLTLIFMMNLVRKSLSIEIDGFMNHLQNYIGDSLSFNSFTKSAYVQVRKKIKAEVFKELLLVLTKEFYTDNDSNITRWNNLLLLAVDGTTLNLPSTKELHEIYGSARNQNGDTSVQGRGSVLYDLLNKLVLDAQLSPRCISERSLALKHLDKTPEDSLIIFDRGYYSFEFTKKLTENKVNFLFRLKSDLKIVKSFISSRKNTQIIEITPRKYIRKSERNSPENAPITIRLVKVKLPDGEIEVLATSLLDEKKYPTKEFKTLYFKRWKVETYYDELKNKLKTELFTGYSNTAIQQDFHATILISNIQSLIVLDVEDEIKELTKNRKLEYKVNINLSYGFLKYRILNLLFSEEKIEEKIEEIKMLFKRHLEPVRPNRKVPRPYKRRRKTKRLEVTKNQRDAI